MSHLQAMIDRLPHLYRDGSHVHELLSLAALQLEIWDEDATEVQRAHWLDSALELEEAARLAEILNIELEEWQGLGEFRAWVHAFRNARLQEGSVTVNAIKRFIQEYSQAYQSAVEIELIPDIDIWSDTAVTGKAFFDENPDLFRQRRIPSSGGLEPLQQFTIEQKGLDATAAGFLVIGLAESQEFVPVIVNTSNGSALVYRGSLKTGQRLWLVPSEDGGVSANLEQEDVTDRLYSIENLTPGQSWELADMASPAKAITLGRGKNSMWFFPLAHYDEQGLDRFLFSLPDTRMHQGRYGKTNFNNALFYQAPAIILYTLWHEKQPATFDVSLPAGALKNQAGRLEESLGEMDRLAFSLNSGVNQLAAAGVASSVTLEAMQESQPLGDFLTTVIPINVTDTGPTGVGKITDSVGVFSVTEFEDSTFE